MASFSKSDTQPRTRFRSDTRGNIAILTALLMFPLIGVGGLAIDHMQADSAKVRIDNAADAAALAAVNTAKAIAAGNATWGSGDPLEAGRAAAARMFRANSTSIGQADQPQPEINIERVGAEYVASVSWSTTTPATFGRLFGKASHVLSGTAEARSGVGLYHDFFIMMDMSASMLIGATPADISRTFNLLSCAFACHLQNDSLAYIRSQGGVRMRIDVMKDAIVTALEELRRRAAMPGQYRFAVYTFSNEVRTFLDISDPRARDFDAVIATVRAADPWRSNGGGTNFTRALGEVERKLTSGNTGTMVNPMQRVILISDGVQNERRIELDAYTWGNDPMVVVGPSYTIGPITSRMSGMDPGGCNRMKAKGAEVAMVHVQYINPLTVPGVIGDAAQTDEFGFIEKVLIPDMANTMGACASSTQLYADANTPAEIYAAIQGAFASPRRTVITN